MIFTNTKNLYFETIFLGSPCFATQILTLSPPKLKMNFFNSFLQILFYDIPIHNNNTQDNFQVHFCDFHYALMFIPRRGTWYLSQDNRSIFQSLNLNWKNDVRTNILILTYEYKYLQRHINICTIFGKQKVFIIFVWKISIKYLEKALKVKFMIFEFKICFRTFDWS